MENIFEGAKFGDKFVTKVGFQAIYCKYCTKDGSNWYHSLIVDCESVADLEYDNNGVAIACCDDFDIVSGYQEPIGEEKLDELAIEMAIENKDHIATSYANRNEQMIMEGYRYGYSDGYKKAKEE